MDIAIISTFDNTGGAAIAANRLYKGLRLLKQNPIMVVKNKRLESGYIYTVRCEDPGYNIEQMIFQNIQETGINQDRSEHSNTLFSFPYPGYDFSESPVIAGTDIINLHWVAGFQSVETVSRLLNLEKPVVWTLHDENPYTGGCHYTAGCTGYQTDCGDCLQLKNNPYRIPYYNLKNKIKLWNKNLTIVTPSKWLAECAKKSRVFKDLRIEIIPNSLETDLFKPKAKDLAKKELGLDPRLIILLFGAYTGHEKRKGFFKLMDAMKYCLQDKEFKNLAKKGRIKILTFGPPQVELQKLEIKIQSMGLIDIDNKDKLSTIYSAADMFVLPSLEDNLPNTILEAMACGTPVLGFEVGGLPDIIQNRVTGYTVPGFDSKKFGQLIRKPVFHKKEIEQMGQNCRQLVEKKFKLQDQAKNYLELFNDLLKNKNGPRKIEKSKKNIPEDKNIITAKWNPIAREDFFEIYRKSTVNLLTKWDKQIENLPERLKKDEEISKIFGSYTYRIGSLITFPLKKIRNLYRKIRKPSKNLKNMKKI